jgi:hypothetical protein
MVRSQTKSTPAFWLHAMLTKLVFSSRRAIFRAIPGELQARTSGQALGGGAKDAA